MNNKILMLLTFILVAVFGIRADEHGWTVNPYDFQYDMTAYVRLNVDGQDVSDLTNYEIAAFCGDQCRGVVEAKSVNGHQYGYLRIRSNQAQGETITFRIYNKVNEKNVRSDNTLTFSSDSSVGYPSKPYVIKGVNQYEVAFVVDDRTNVTYQYYGDRLTAPEDPVKEGYEFTGWMPELAETVPAHNLIYTASFRVLSFTVSFYVDDELYEKRVFDYGTEILPPSMPEKTGYTFAGWKPFPNIMPAHDIEVYGSYNINSYKLTYMVDGVKYKEYEVDYDSVVVPEEDPTKEGYTFSGWDNVPERMPADNVTVSGEFRINSYKLTYMIGDEVVSEEVYEYNANIRPATPPEKEGYSFAGWENLPERMPARDLTINGSYTVNSYKLTYMLDGDVYKESAVDYGTALVAEAAPEKEGYTFSGWEGLPETMPAHDVTVSGSFSVNSYTLTYMVDGEVFSSVVVNYGESIPEVAAPVKEGYTFTGWEGLPETMPAEDVTVTASFTVKYYTLTYMVDGEVYKTESVAYGEAVEAEAAPEKEGYTFSGWEGVPEVMPAYDVTVTGSFKVNTYTLTYEVDGSVYMTFRVDYGQDIPTVATPEKEGYTFSGWEGMPETMPAGDVTVTGSFSINYYTLTYEIDGEVYKTLSIAYGEAVEAEAAPEKEGYTFSGWGAVPEVMPAYDVTISGFFTVNYYLLTIYLNDKEYLTAELEYGSNLQEFISDNLNLPESWKFTGWVGEVPETMPAYDLDIYGTYTYTSSVDSIFENEGKVTVYTLGGVLLYKDAEASEVYDLLAPGYYIVNGKKHLRR